MCVGSEPKWGDEEYEPGLLMARTCRGVSVEGWAGEIEKFAPPEELA